MSPEQLIERLEGMGILDDKILGKLRREVKNPEKSVKPSQILRYLVKKGLLTQPQSDALQAEIDAPQPVVHEEIEVAVVEETYDTDDLTATVAPNVAPQQVEVVEAVIEEEAETADIVEAIPEPTYAQPQMADPLADPMADPFANPAIASGANSVQAPLNSGAHQTHESKLAKSFSGKNYRPDQWQTKWLYIGFGILGTLLLFGAVLYIAVGRQSSEDLYKAINKSFAEGALGDAIAKSGDFLEKFPNDQYAPRVTTLRVQCLIAQSFKDKDWDETINRAANLMPPLVEREELDLTDLRADLSTILPTAALKITERALQQETIAGMEKELKDSREAVAVASNPVNVVGSEQKRKGEIYQQMRDNILLVEGRIVKENRYNETLEQITQLREAGQTDQAFLAFRDLTRDYGDLAARAELRDEMLKVSVKERELVKPISVDLPVQNSEQPSNFETIVLEAKTGNAIPALIGEVTPVLADGTLFGIDVGDGSVKWRRFLGYETSIQPLELGLDFLIVCDQRTHDILCIGRKDNSLLWKIGVSEAFVAPTLNEEFLIVTTKSGKILKINHLDGKVMAACQLPQQANVSALILPRDPYIYQIGLYSNLYVLSTEDLSCRDVFYLGHAKGAVQVPPVYWSGHILAAVNGGRTSNLHVLKGENGLALKLLQLFPNLTGAPVTLPMARIARGMMVLAENGDMKVMLLNTVDEESPVEVMVDWQIETSGNTGIQVCSNKSTLYFAGNGITRTKLRASQSTFAKPLILNHTDSFIAPMAVYDDALIHVRKRDGSSMVSISAVDATELTQIWRNDLQGALAGSPAVKDGKITAISSQGDLFQVEPGAAVASDRIPASKLRENLVFTHRFSVDGGLDVAVGPPSRMDMLTVDWQKNKTNLTRLDLNGAGGSGNRATAAPIALGSDLIVPTNTGAVMRIDGKSGSIVGTPFLPPVSPGSEQIWRRPAMVGEASFAIAKAADQNGAGSHLYVLDGSKRGALVSVADKPSSPVVSDLAASGSIVYAVIQGQEGQELVAMNTADALTEVATAKIDGAYVSGPWRVGELVLMTTDNDELVCFDTQLQQKWRYPMPEIRLAGAPAFSNGALVLAFENGELVFLSGSDGSVAGQMSLNEPLSGTPFIDNGKAYLGGADGTIHVVPFGS